MSLLATLTRFETVLRHVGRSLSEVISGIVMWRFEELRKGDAVLRLGIQNVKNLWFDFCDFHIFGL